MSIETPPEHIEKLPEDHTPVVQEQVPHRPSQEDIQLRVKALLREMGEGRMRGSWMEETTDVWRVCAQGLETDASVNKIRAEYYPGWENEDFALLLAAFEKAERKFTAQRKMHQIRSDIGVGDDMSIDGVIKQIRELDSAANASDD
jgi:hypothetical protein